MGTIVNGKELTTVSVEQIRALADKIHEAKASAVGSMKEAFLLKHEQGALLVQAEMELGDAFETFVDNLANDGVDPDQARDNYRLAKKFKDRNAMLSSPQTIKQLIMRGFAPEAPKQEAPPKSANLPAFVLTLVLNKDPLDFTQEEWRQWESRRRAVDSVEEVRTGVSNA